MVYIEIQCLDCKSKFSEKALFKTKYKCPECSKQITYTETQCPSCNTRFPQDLLIHTKHRCPKCGRQKTSRHWKTFIVK